MTTDADLGSEAAKRASSDGADAVSALCGELAAGVHDLLGEAAGEVALLPRHRRHLLLALVDSGVAASAMVRLGLSAPAGDLLRWAFGDQVSPRYASVLRRLGPAPLRKGAYATLNQRLWKEKKLARALTHLQSVDSTVLAIALALPSALHHPHLLLTVPSGPKARQLAAAFELAVRHNGRDKVTLASALQRAPDWNAIWKIASKAVTPDLLPVPWPGDDELVPVPTRAALMKVGVEFQNCLRRRAPRIALQQDIAVYVWKGSGPGRDNMAVAVVGRDCFGHFLEDLEGFANRPPPADVVLRIKTKLATVGIVERPSAAALLLTISDGEAGIGEWLEL